MKTGPLHCSAVTLCLLVLSTSVLAQQPGGTISGVVSDASGANIAGAAVRITHRATRFHLDSKTNTTGSYTVWELAPGDYELQISVPGFRAAIVELGVEIGRVTTANVRLEVGVAADAVTVTATALRVNPVQTALEGMVSKEMIDRLPLNGRNFLELGQLEPGAQFNSSSLLNKGAYSRLSFSGHSGVTTRVTVDGLDIFDEHAGTVAQNISQDAVEEYQVSRASFDIATGLTGSGAVNIATRSGTNDVHGSAFIFWRDHTLAARLGPSDLPFHRLQGGFQAGGPVRRDRVFWFANYERNHQNGEVVTHIDGFSQFDGAWPLPFDERMAMARLDANLRPELRAFLRFTHNWNKAIPANTFGGTVLSPLQNTGQANQTAAGTDLVHGRWHESWRFGFLNYHNTYDTLQDQIPGLPRALGPGGANVTVVFGSNGPAVGPWQNGPGRRLQHKTEFRYDGGVTAGRHTWRWGADVNLIRVNWFEAINSNAPRVVVNAGDRAICGSNVWCYRLQNVSFGNGLGFWTEKPCLGQPYGCIPSNRVHWYGGDSWRVTPHLNVNFGLRWVYEPGPDNPDLSKPAIQDAFFPGRGQRNRRDLNNFAPQLGVAWSPGSAGKWVVRASAGVFYDTNLLKHVIFERNQALPPGITQENVAVNQRPLTDPLNPQVDLGYHFEDWQNRRLQTTGLIDAIVQAAQAFKAAYQRAYAQFPSGPTRCELRLTSCDTFGPNYTTPYSFHFTAGMQHELAPGLVVSADYVRTRGLHLMSTIDQNRVGAADTLNVAAAWNAITKVNASNSRTLADYVNAGLGSPTPLRTAVPGAPSTAAFAGMNPAFNKMTLYAMGGIATYNALHLNLRGRVPFPGELFHDWSAVASYSLGRLETAGTFEDSALLNTADKFFNDAPLRFRGPAELDRRHMLSIGNLFTVPGGVRLSSIWRAFSALPQSVMLPASSNPNADIFISDLDGDGSGGDPLPGTNRGSYGRDIGCGARALNRLIDAYNSTQANHLTPAGRALVNAELFTEPQLMQLGAYSPVLPQAPAGQACLDSFITTDLRISRPFHLRRETITLEPALEIFNLFNVANFDLPDNKLNGVLSGQPGTLNGTPVMLRTNRAGFVGGSFSTGTPRSWQLAVRVSF